MLHVLILLIATLTEGSPPVAPSRLLVTRIGPCYELDLSKDVVTVSEMTLSRELYDSSLTGYINVTEDIPNGWTIKVTMQKCHDIRNIDTCDLLRQFRIVNNGCADSEEGDLYTMFFHYVQPKLDCPIKAGNYKITEYPFFTEDSDLTATESKISTSVFGYTYRLQAYNEDDKRLACTDANLQLLYLREHGWVGKKNFHPISPSVPKTHVDQPMNNEASHDSGDKQMEENDNDGDKAQDTENNTPTDEQNEEQNEAQNEEQNEE